MTPELAEPLRQPSCKWTQVPPIWPKVGEDFKLEIITIYATCEVPDEPVLQVMVSPHVGQLIAFDCFSVFFNGQALFDYRSLGDKMSFPAPRSIRRPPKKRRSGPPLKYCPSKEV